MLKVSEPVFYDTTLRDGNEALKHPWTYEEKLIIFNKLVSLGVKAIEVGFPASNDKEFFCCQKLAEQAPDDVIVGVLSCAMPESIEAAAACLQKAKHPRMNLFLPMNTLGLKYVLKKDIVAVTKMAIEAIQKAKFLCPANTEIEFSVEQFGDCKENFSDVLDAIEKIANAGVDVINLPNTVERTRPFEFVEMVKQVKQRVGDKVQLSVHCHNDLGMATATTVESFFAGAVQLETTLNGLGERCGNANMFEVAMALHNSGVNVPLKMEQFYDLANFVAEMSGITICEKAPLVGKDCLTHRSGIHQDGANKTRTLHKRQYLAYEPELIGRKDGEKIFFTNQSGKAALQALCAKNGYYLSKEQLIAILPKAKSLAAQKGELSRDDLVSLCLQCG